MDIPSGILWRVIASVKDSPKLMFLVVEIKVAIPSGMLWIMIANMDISPTLYKELLLVVGNVLSINIERKIPIMTKVKLINIIVKLLYFFNIFRDSGIKSVIDTQSITPDAKAKEAQIIFSSLLILKKIKVVPNMVESPAMVVSRKAIFILFIYISPIKYMKKD